MNCFVAGTLVMTAVGSTPIEDIKAGDFVWARDDQSEAPVLRRVLQTFVTEDQEIVALELRADDANSNELLESTPGHPFWVRDTGWVQAADLWPGDELLTGTGAWMEVHSITAEPTRQRVFNFEVDGAHSYFVGDFGVWVHNISPLTTAEFGLTEAQAARVARLEGTVETVGMQRNIQLDWIRAVGDRGGLRAPGPGQIRGGLTELFQNAINRARAEGLTSVGIRVSQSSHGDVVNVLRRFAAEVPSYTHGTGPGGTTQHWFDYTIRF